MEYIYKVNTEEENLVSVETEKIAGKLQGVIIESDKAIRISITLRDHPSIRLLKLDNFNGEKYLSIRDQVINCEGERLNYQSAAYVLSDVLLLTVSAAKNTNVIVKIRTEIE